MAFKPTKDPSLSEEEQIARDVAKVKRTNDRRDMQRLIRTVLASPLSSNGEVLRVDGERSIESFKKKNTDVQTRIVINAALGAASGDAKARDFIFKYGGFEPVKEQSVSVDLPTFVDDMGEPEPVPTGLDEDDAEIYDGDDERWPRRS